MFLGSFLLPGKKRTTKKRLIDRPYLAGPSTHTLMDICTYISLHARWFHNVPVPVCGTYAYWLSCKVSIVVTEFLGTRYWSPIKICIMGYMHNKVRGGGTQLFFGGCVPHGLQKIGSRVGNCYVVFWGLRLTHCFSRTCNVLQNFNLTKIWEKNPSSMVWGRQ